MAFSKKTIRNKTDFDSILARIRHYCAYQERCSYDVSLKLNEWKITPDKQQEIKQQLVAEGFLMDDRFARIYVRSKFHFNKWGRMKIRYELKLRSIPEPVIEKAMEEIGEEDYVKTLRELIQKKKEEIYSGKHLNIREKIITFVTGKGFEFDLISKVLTEFNI